MPDQEQITPTTETTQTPDIDSAALTIYDTLSKEGYDTEQMIGIIKSLKGLIASDIDEKLKYFTRLKQGI